MKLSLNIGINYSGRYQLRGCQNDATNLAAFFQAKQYDVIVMTDSPNHLQPTRGNILAVMRDCVKKLKKGDVFVITYSGHGTRIRDTSGDEIDHLDDAICPSDFPETNMTISDDVIHSLICSIVEGVTVYAFFDCCHSGTVMDLRYNYNSEKGFFISDGRHTCPAANVICISGCADTQTSADTWEGGQYCGALSYALLNSFGNSKTIVELLNSVKKFMVTHGYEQVPQLSAGTSTIGSTYRIYL